MRFSNGQLLNAPGNVNIIGNYKQPNWSLHRQFNTCYENTAGTPVNTVTNGTYNTITACDTTSPTPAFIQRLPIPRRPTAPISTFASNITHWWMLSLFKQFAIKEGVNFEIRGEFFNVLNTPDMGRSKHDAWRCKRRIFRQLGFDGQPKRRLFPGQRSAYRPAHGAHQLLNCNPLPPRLFDARGLSPESVHVSCVSRRPEGPERLEH